MRAGDGWRAGYFASLGFRVWLAWGMSWVWDRLGCLKLLVHGGLDGSLSSASLLFWCGVMDGMARVINLAHGMVAVAAWDM